MRRKLYLRAKNMSKIKRPLDLIGGEFIPMMEHDQNIKNGVG